MYHSIKKIISGIVGRKLLVSLEIPLRRIYSVLYTGNKHECPVCHKKLSRFIPVHNNNEILCPQCGSLARDRRLWMLLKNEFLDINITVLDFSPSRPLARNMARVKKTEYLNTDLSGNFIAKHRFDITNLELQPESVDLIICYHILEHIDNDQKAMSELYRVLKPTGKILIQTPFKDGDIYEDSAITLPAEREKHFGQDDHVRVYSVNGLKSRLEKAGFVTHVRNYTYDTYHGLLDNENIFVLTKQ